MEHTHTTNKKKQAHFQQGLGLLLIDNKIVMSTRFEFIQAVNCVCNIPVKVSIRFVGFLWQTLKWESGPCTTSVILSQEPLDSTMVPAVNYIWVGQTRA